MGAAAIHVLADNRSEADALAFEHGWSAWIDCGADGCILWDTGQTGVFLQNARILGMDPVGARCVALSHGHHDHAGGLAALLAAGTPARSSDIRMSGCAATAGAAARPSVPSAWATAAWPKASRTSPRSRTSPSLIRV